MTWAIDLDGVLCLGDTPIPGAVEAVARLRSRGQDVVFLTNNSRPTAEAYLEKLRSMGLEISGSELITSAQSAARLVAPGGRALVLGGPGIVEALTQRGVEVVREGPVDAVVVGGYRTFDFDHITVAACALHSGAVLIGTNADATYPTPEGLLPGAGALLAAVGVAGGVAPVVAGKPHEPMVALLEERAGKIEVVVGDQPATDGVFARRIGARFALVLTGVTAKKDLPVAPEPDEVVATFADLVA